MHYMYIAYMISSRTPHGVKLVLDRVIFVDICIAWIIFTLLAHLLGCYGRPIYMQLRNFVTAQQGGAIAQISEGRM